MRRLHRPISDFAKAVFDPVEPKHTPAAAFQLYSFEAFDDRQPTETVGATIQSSKWRIQDGDVLFAKLNPRIPRVWLVGKEATESAICSTEFVPLRMTTDDVLPAYLEIAVQAPQCLAPIQAAVKSTTKSHQRVRPDFILQQCISVPSRPEQHRIVARVREAMERVEEIEHLRGEIEANGRRMFVQFVRERFASMTDHELVPLGGVAEMIGGGSLPEALDSEDSDGAILGVKVGDLNLPGNEVEVSTSRGFVRAGTRGRIAPAGSTVLPKRGGAIATNKKRRLGRSAMIDPNLMAVVPKAGQLESSFLHAWFEQVDLVRISNGGVIPQLNKKDLVPLRIPRLPLDVQRQIGEEVDRARTACSALVNSGEDAARDVAALRTSILRQAFSGKL